MFPRSLRPVRPPHSGTVFVPKNWVVNINQRLSLTVHRQTLIPSKTFETETPFVIGPYNQTLCYLAANWILDEPLEAHSVLPQVEKAKGLRRV